ncbi:family 43 glycosylhydrolase [Cellvibrio polysaccharolyticus]|uniref:Beta-xylosidase n=1 Tax=Cellvibrio polysaccharolyticus TaxID=2082724 RepID=A0A928UZS2_9GAMM|nr:family 43 glycosylhydrolase [Cellvibrio polysaccharolyticus]MBE8716206.1 beta-xylosidase [Cellvibrio polysaccharolyticus]
MLHSVRARAAKCCSLLLLGFSLTSVLPATALDLTGLVNSHDPGAIVRDGDTLFHFTTGHGVWYSTSTNLTHWTGAPSTVFGSSWPSWINSAVPGFDGHFWAPDVIQMGNYYYLYYSASTFGSSTSAIGVARSPSLKNPAWQDLGVVVQSYGGFTEMNAIDPALFRDYDGKVYMSYGSFFGGIGIAEINQSTGKLASSVSHIYGGGHQDIEAPYITRDGDYYYLFVNRGSCCQGANSSYYVQVSRSTSIYGPWSGTRTILGNVSGKYKGPGHIGLLKENGCNYVSTHYYDLNDNGNAKLDILRMTYSGGWPVLTRNFSSVSSCGGVSDGIYSLTARHSNRALAVDNASTANGAFVEQYGYSGAANQKWYVIGQNAGNYSLINVNSLKSLDVWELSTAPGARIAQWDYWGGDGQKWKLDASGSHFVVRSVLSGLALDVLNMSTANDAQVIQWNLTGATNQQWSMIRR